MKFRKKPVIIEVEAMQLKEDNFDEVLSFLNKDERDGWIDIDQIVFFDNGMSCVIIVIDDWLVKLPDNDFIACKPDEFEKDYEKVDYPAKNNS